MTRSERCDCNVFPSNVAMMNSSTTVVVMVHREPKDSIRQSMKTRNNKERKADPKYDLRQRQVKFSELDSGPTEMIIASGKQAFPSSAGL